MKSRSALPYLVAHGMSGHRYIYTFEGDVEYRWGGVMYFPVTVLPTYRKKGLHFR